MSDKDILRYARQYVQAAALARNATLDGFSAEEAEKMEALRDRMHDAMVTAVWEYETQVVEADDREQSALALLKFMPSLLEIDAYYRFATTTEEGKRAAEWYKKRREFLEGKTNPLAELQAENERLKAALREIWDIDSHFGSHMRKHGFDPEASLGE